MNRRTYRNRWLLYHSRYERKGLTIFRKAIKEACKGINFDQLTKVTYETSIRYNVKQEPLNQAFFNLHYTIGLAHGKRIGREINKELRQDEKAFDPIGFEESYRNFVARWLIENAGTNITSVRSGLIDYLLKFISERVEQGININDIGRELQKHVLSRGFYRWQIMRIVTTETTGAANRGALRAGTSSGVLWDKEWISANDSRTRRRPDDQYDHWQMNEKREPKDGKFNVQGDLIEYPGDPKGQPGNIINCRCAVAVVPRRDSNGKIIRREGSIFA